MSLETRLLIALLSACKLRKLEIARLGMCHHGSVLSLVVFRGLVVELGLGDSVAHMSVAFEIQDCVDHLFQPDMMSLR